VKKTRKSTPQKTSESARETKLTLRQRKFIAGKLKGHSSLQAARNAGYSESVSRKADAIISDSPHVHAVMNAILEAAGVSNERLARRMREGLDATVVHHQTMHSRREVLIDFGERREMVELALRVKGLLVEKHRVQMVKTLEEILEESSKS